MASFVSKKKKGSFEELLLEQVNENVTNNQRKL
jgi:hypothetical protein